MNEKEIQTHLQEALNLYRKDLSALREEYNQKIGVLNEENQRLIQQHEQAINKSRDDHNRLFQELEAERDKYNDLCRRIKITLDDAKKKIDGQKKQIDGLVNEKNALQQDYEYRIEKLEAENRRLQRETAKSPYEAGYEGRRASEHEERPVILDAFNKWAANPAPRTLASDFQYVEGEFRIRSKNDYKPSSSDGSKWIVNTRGGKKYLLPNPLFFDMLTNINELYRMDRSRLQPSNNKIKVTKPCELLDEGYINYPGELTIL